MSLAREQPRARNFSPWIIGGILLAIVAAFGVWAYVNTRPAAATAARRDVTANLPLDGEVVVPPGHRADIYSAYRAPVAKIYTSVGQKVRRGEVLVELQFTNAQAAYEQARENVKAAETAYANARSSYASLLTAAQQRLSAARAAEQAARRPVAPPAPQVQVSPDGTATAITPATPTSPQPSANLQAAAQERVAAAQEMAQAQAGYEAALVPYKQQLDAARAAFQEAQSGRKRAMLRAPISGEVMALNAQPGAEVGKDRKQPVVTVVDLSALQVQATMNKEQGAEVKPRMPVTVTIAEMPNQQFEGQVTAVTSLPDKLLSGPRYAAIIDFKNSQGLVKLGMKGRASVKLGEVKNAVTVPADAVDKDKEGRPYVEVLKGGQWIRTLVEVGISDGQYTEIRSGVKEGDTVKVTPDLTR